MGVRYLIAGRNAAAQAVDGNLVELLLRRTGQPVDTAALLANLYRGYLRGQLAAPGQAEGLVLLYSADYEYLTGRRFRNGQLLPGTAALAFQRHGGSAAIQSANTPANAARFSKTGSGGEANIQQGGSCIDWYDTRTGGYLTTTGDCGGGGGGGGGGGVYEGGGGPGGMGDGPDGYGGHGPRVGSGGAPTSAPTVTLNISLAPCQTAVYNNLLTLNDGMLAFIVQKFGGTATGYNWRLLNGTLPTGTYGSTGPYDRTYRVITTTFDASQWRNATDLSIARTMMHEAVHAYLVTYFAQEPLYARADYPALLAAWDALGVGGNANIAHHNVMGQQGWLGDLAWGLQQYGQSRGYNLPAQYYADMAWGGLETSQAFLALPAADQNRITNLLRVEATGKDQQGDSQLQSGQPAGCR